MESPPTWFRSFIICEAALQLPFFFFVIHGLVRKSNSIRIPSIVYGAHVATTVIPILAEFIASPTLMLSEKIILCGVYSPYLVVPVMLCLYMCFNDEPFTGTKQKSRKSN